MNSTHKNILFVLLSVVILSTACSKSKDNDPSGEETDQDASSTGLPKEISNKLLSNYLFIEEFTVASAYVGELGDQPRLFAYAVEDRGSFGYAVRVYDPIGWSQENATSSSYNVTAGTAKIQTAKGHIEVKRESDGTILLTKGLQFKDVDEGKKYVSKYTQVITLDGKDYFDSSFKAVETVTGFYRFSEKYWRFAATVPTESEVSWLYNRLTPHIWFGRDAGTAKYDNRFIIIPKGNGWKGQHKDKVLMLVNVTKGTKGVQNIVVCTKD